MEPLKQFVCDICGELIEKPEDGYVIWRTDDDNRIIEMLIVHHCNVTDEGYLTGCDRDYSKYPLSSDLESFLGVHGLVKLLALVDPGPHFVSEYQERIIDKRMFLQIFRRLHIPYYEEARLYWNRAMNDGYFSGANEVWMYLPETLKALIEEYGVD